MENVFETDREEQVPSPPADDLITLPADSVRVVDPDEEVSPPSFHLSNQVI